MFRCLTRGLLALTCLAVAAPAGAQTATQREGGRLEARVVTPTQQAAASELRVRLTARRSGTARLSGSLIQRRTVRLRAWKPVTVKLRLTRAGRARLRGCADRTAAVTVTFAGRRYRASRRLPAGRPSCATNPIVPTAPAVPAEPASTGGDVATWGYDLRGSRHNPVETAIRPDTVKSLELKWSFVFGDTDEAASSQPAVVGDTLFVGARNGRFYALDAATGKEKWVFDTRTVTGETAQRNLLRDGPAVAGGLVVFGDFEGFVYAVEAATGKLRWATEADPHPLAILTGSPTIHDGRVYIGVSSNEVFTAISPSYPCCQFRGSLLALDLQTGRPAWRYHTTGEPQRTGTNGYGAATYAPSGVSVWSTPAIDAETGTVFFGTAQNYTGDSPKADALIALDAKTGRERWVHQFTKNDQWSAACLAPAPGGNCPAAGPDFDFGSSPNLLRVNGRTLVGAGQKSGIYHAVDAATGVSIWDTTLNPASGEGGAGGQNGIQWGSAYDGTRIYAATNQADPGALFALDPATGKVLWKTPHPDDGCTTGGAAFTRPGDCTAAFPAAVSSVPGLVFEGSRDGKLRAFAAATGEILWTYDTVMQYMGVNGLVGRGGSIGHGGATISRGMLYVNSGYQTAGSPATGIPGSVLLAFGPKGGTR
jgi:polyvinyl alcohol dehydrogenase (cytochrome)